MLVDAAIVPESGGRCMPPIVGMTPIDEQSKVKIIRQGDRKVINVKIGLLPDQEELQLASGKSNNKVVNRLGIVVSDLTTEQREQFQVIKGGVLIQQVNQGVARAAGIQRGDVILRIRNHMINDADDFDTVVKELPADKSIAVLIQRRGSPIFLAIKLEK